MKRLNNLVYNLKINNLKWEIRFVSEDSLKLDNATGITYRCEEEIYIGQNYKDDLLLRIIQHELTHAYIWSYGLDYTEEGKNWNEEEICQFMESHGEAIVRDSKKIFDWNKKVRREDK